jgi:hypothetical protein
MNWSIENHIALASAFVAGCALWITIWQGRQNLKHNKLSVRPFLGAKIYYSPKGNKGFVSFELMNCGTGPAIIKDFVLFYGDKEVSRNDTRTYNKFLNKQLAMFSEVTPFDYGSGTVMKINETQALLTFKYHDNQNQSAVNFIDKLNFLVIYQSIYRDEIFTYDSREKRVSGKIEDKGQKA